MYEKALSDSLRNTHSGSDRRIHDLRRTSARFQVLLDASDTADCREADRIYDR